MRCHALGRRHAACTTSRVQFSRVVVSIGLVGCNLYSGEQSSPPLVVDAAHRVPDAPTTFDARYTQLDGRCSDAALAIDARALDARVVVPDARVTPDARIVPPDAPTCPAPPPPTSVEALFELDRIAGAAKAYYLANGHFPPQDGDFLPSTTACASGGANPVSTWFGGWRTLGFEIGIPNLFNYRYTGGAQAATANAYGDLDCDGTSITYTLVLTADGTTPTAAISSPPPGAD